MLFTKKREANAAPRGRVLARGERTILREFERADIDRWVAWPRHPDPLFDSYNPPVLTERQRDLYYRQRMESTDTRQFSVDDLHGHFIGRISLREIDWQHGASVLGVSFHPGRLNQGLGSDALWQFLGFYFGRLNMSALFLDVAAFNLRAYRVYEKCGFHRCGQRWGDAQTDVAGVFRRRDYENIRHLFHWEYGLVRPLLIDMVVRRPEWERLHESRESSRPERPSA
ncbi:MAG: GCN5-related N-acetyltransferase [Armatimonadetes bacterium]|jgi:RimJ/RimL family protein N-acetyltransferase|nr:GCN5-related N-acetyltransferase [Armatimonadota bacterium]